MFVSPNWCQLWPFTFDLTKIPIFILLSGICMLQLQAEIQPYLKTLAEHQVELMSQPGTILSPNPGVTHSAAPHEKATVLLVLFYPYLGFLSW